MKSGILFLILAVPLITLKFYTHSSKANKLLVRWRDDRVLNVYHMLTHVDMT